MSAQPEKREQAALPLLENDVLRTFVAIAETGSFTRAARQVFRTPSAVSMQIKRLEETLGKALFVREPRRVTLTPEGETLMSYGRRLLALNEEAVSAFVAPPVEGTVHFGTPDDVGTRILPGVLSQFARTHPAVEVNVVVGRSADMIRRLDAGELDIVLVTAGGDHADRRRGDIVHTEPLVWAAREGGIAAERRPLPLALAASGCPWRAATLAALDRSGHRYRIAYTSEHCAGQEAAMLADLAIAPFPRSLVRPPLRCLGDEVNLPALGNYHIELRQRASPGAAAESLAGYVVEAFRSLPA